MTISLSRLAAPLGLAIALIWPSVSVGSTVQQPSRPRLMAAIFAMATLTAPGEEGLVTIWDDDSYIQCRAAPGYAIRCEAAGALMQPSLRHILAPERVDQLVKLGWRLDPSFGNYARTFSSGATIGQVAEDILKSLDLGYGADLSALGIRGGSIPSQPCPPRRGPRQNLAGAIDDSPATASTDVHGCAYTPPLERTTVLMETDAPTKPVADLFGLYGDRTTREIHRLRTNVGPRVFAAFDTGLAYVQCEPQTAPSGLYCEAESAESSAGLVSVLTPERVARLHAAGFADPGRTQNYSKTYPPKTIDDAPIARELLSILHDVYGYDGSPTLKIATEHGGD